MHATTTRPLTRFRLLLSRDGGFGLMEVLATIVVVGLLAAIAVPQISKYREKSYVTAMESDLRSASNAMEAAALGNEDGAYPASVDGLYQPTDHVTITLDGGGTGGSESTPSVPLPEHMSHLRLPGAASQVTVKGVSISVAPDGDDTLKVTVKCPASLPNGLQNLLCIGNDGNQFILWADASPGPAPTLLCNTTSGVVQVAGRLNSSNVSVRTTRAAEPGYVTNGPITAVTGTSTCPTGGKAVGFSYNGLSISGTSYVNRRFQMAWGITAQDAAGEEPTGGPLCLEASHSKSDKVRSWTPDGGMVKNGC